MQIWSERPGRAGVRDHFRVTWAWGRAGGWGRAADSQDCAAAGGVRGGAASARGPRALRGLCACSHGARANSTSGVCSGGLGAVAALGGAREVLLPAVSAAVPSVHPITAGGRMEGLWRTRQMHDAPAALGNLERESYSLKCMRVGLRFWCHLKPMLPTLGLGFGRSTQAVARSG